MLSQSDLLIDLLLLRVLNQSDLLIDLIFPECSAGLTSKEKFSKKILDELSYHVYIIINQYCNIVLGVFVGFCFQAMQVTSKEKQFMCECICLTIIVNF